MSFNILDKLIPFLILPIISRLLTVDEMGYYILFQAVYNFVLPLITLNSDSGIMLNHYHLDKERFKIYFASGIFLFFLVFCSFCIVTPLLSSFFDKIFGFETFYLYLIYGICFCYFFNRINLNIWQKEKQPIKFGIFTIALTLTKNVLMLYFLFYHRELSWTGIIYSQAIAQFVFFLYSVIFFIKKGLVNLNINKTYMTEVIKIGSPLTIHQLGAWSGNLASRLIINTMIGTAAAGQFGIGATFGIIMTLIQDSFNKAFTPFLFERLKEIDNEISPDKIEKLKGKLVKLTFGYNGALLLFAIIISLIGYWGVDIIFGSKYSESKIFIFWVVFSSMFNGMYKMHIGYMFYKKKTSGIANITISTGVLNLLLCYTLIYFTDSPLGAAQALLVTQFISYLLSWKMSDRIYPMPWFKFK